MSVRVWKQFFSELIFSSKHCMILEWMVFPSILIFMVISFSKGNVGLYQEFLAEIPWWRCCIIAEMDESTTQKSVYTQTYMMIYVVFFQKSFAFLSFHSIIQSTLYYKFTNMEKSQISQEEALKTIEEIRRDMSPSWGKRRFFRHLIIYILVISFLWFLNLRGESDQTGFWAIYPTIGWGIAVMIHFIRTTF